MRKKPAKRRQDNYEVGYGRPPKHTRWKQGQSGNSRGRPRGAKRLSTILDEVMRKKIAVQEGGKTIMMTIWEAVVRTVRNKALQGDLKSIEFLLKQEPQMARDVEAAKRPKITEPISAEAALKAYQAMINAK